MLVQVAARAGRAMHLNARLSQDIRYLIRLEPGVQTPEDTLTRASGSCRDSAWLLVQLLRHLGLAARFVSGYLIQLTADVKALEGPSGPEADFTDLHAWCEVYLPGAGWVGLDPTSGLFAGEGHIPLACSPEPASAAPITGLVSPCDAELEHLMQVTRIRETPRVTKPYTDAQWADILTLGEQVDADLRAGDVRLTMGGEPTFVALDDRDGAEWNTQALGPTKRLRAAELFHRLRAHYAPQGVAHFGQGKWYPGEQLPRWSLNCFWRRDGEPVWHDPRLCADERQDYGAHALLGEQFLVGVAARLGVDGQHVFPAFEDAFYYAWRERRLPVNVDVQDPRVSDAQECARLVRVFERGLDQAVGHVLPLARTADHLAWQSGPWFLRRERCLLVPGDSPLGYRLPLDSQPWVSETEYPYLHAPDPMQALTPLPGAAQIRRQVRHVRDVCDAAPLPPAPGTSAAHLTRTALCAEAREGRLYLFMPPVPDLPSWLELVAPWNPGMCSARRGRPVVRYAMWIPRWSGFRCVSAGSRRIAMC